jgi:uncharacterized membrane protein
MRKIMYAINRYRHVIQKLWSVLFHTFWFIPGVVSLCGPSLALFFLALDTHIKGTFPEPYLFHGSALAASTLLSTIAGSLITVAGLAFSITIVALQLVSSQYTPRVLRGFLLDRTTQIVAGGFFAIFSYALIVLTTTREPAPPDPGFIPELSITIAIVLSFLGLILLLLFIHHTGSIIQVPEIAARVAAQTIQAIDQHDADEENDREAQGVSAQIQSSSTYTQPARIYATRVGYIRRIELSHLIRDITCPHLQLSLLVCPGDFVTHETAIAEIWPSDAIDEALKRAIYRHISTERERDITYDAKFGVRQLADIALRALSPAINDPTTSVLCIKYLQAIFEHLARQTQPTTVYHFAQGTSMLTIRRPAFQEYVRMFTEIGHYAGGNARVVNTLLRALTSITKISVTCNKREYQNIVYRIASQLAAHALTQVPDEYDRTHIQEQLDAIEHMLSPRETGTLSADY